MKNVTLFKFFVPTQWHIQDFPQGGAPTPKIAIIFPNFVENCMKMKEFGPGGVPGTPLGSTNATFGFQPPLKNSI